MSSLITLIWLIAVLRSVYDTAYELADIRAHWASLGPL